MIFSVVIPTRDRLPLLQRALASLESQTLPRGEFEVVVVNDASRDGTAALLAERSAAGSVIAIPGRGVGPTAARNAALPRTRGRWLAFLDDDCCAPADWLARAHDALERSGADILGGRAVNRLDSVLSSVYQEMVEHLYERHNNGPGPPVFLTSNNLFVRRDRLQESGGFHPAFPHGAEDRELAARLAARGLRVIYEPELRVDHYHDFTLAGYLAHLRRQGRGSHQLYRVAVEEHGRPLPRPTPRDVMSLVTEVARRPGPGGPLVRGTLALLGQGAVALGYATAMAARRFRRPATLP